DKSLEAPAGSRTRLERDEELAAIATLYETALTAAHALDFDDLIRLPVALLETHPAPAAAIRRRYRWISVDEYQDVNLAQYRLLRLLTSAPSSTPSTPSTPLPDPANPANLCVIGDPDQAIYGFRGADHRYFRQFEQDHPGAVRLRLSRNYRSAPAILDAATQVIARNPDRDAVDIWTDLVSQVKLDVIHTPTDKAEAETVVHRIEQMVGGTSYFSLDSGRVDDRVGVGDDTISHTFGDFAVLYRLNAQARLLAEALDRSGIPYLTAGETPLTARKPIRVILAYLWLRANPHSRVHLAQILGDGKGLFNGADLDKLWPYFDNPGALADRLRAAHDSGDFPKAQRERLLSLAAFWREMAPPPSLPQSGGGADSASKVAYLVEKAHAYHLTLGGETPAGDDVDRLTQRAALFGDRLTTFLENVALQSETDAYDPRADRVALMSIHAAKGLEFPVVFVVGCEDGLLPYRPANRDVDLAEERRLFYVAMTRAKQRLILTHARSRFLFGQSVENPRSPYVDDIQTALLALQSSKRMERPPEPEGKQLSLF
ncbi:MAG: UvrD-helicase domain-containing protein, partial [Caldilineaceae bacterium]|nr:UvrD-helicase domain-containing protein [Caldilineaceae bacterium]